MRAREDVGPHISGIEKRVKAGLPHAPLIAVSEGPDEEHVLVEGHKRATAYVRTREPEATTEVIVGYTDDLSSWEFGRL